MASSEIRQYIINYIKDKQLQLAENPKYFKPDELLTKVFLKNKPAEKLTFEEFFAATFAILSPMHQIKKIHSSKKETVLVLKGKFQPIEFKMENRGGNKKVTCIYNLSAFDLDSDQLQSRMKNKLGCSVTILEQTAAGAASAHQNYIICVQGNQIYPVADILKSKCCEFFSSLLAKLLTMFFGLFVPRYDKWMLFYIEKREFVKWWMIRFSKSFKIILKFFSKKCSNSVWV